MAQTNIFNNIFTAGYIFYDSGIADRLQAIAVSSNNMIAINAAGGVKCWSIPRPLDHDIHYHNSGSPIIFKSSCIFFAVGNWATIPTDAPETFTFMLNGTTYKAYVSPDSTGEVELPLYKEGETTPAVTLKADEMKGVATFDVSGVINTWYQPRPQYTIIPIIEAVDVALRFRVKGLMDSGFTEFLCVRGINDYGTTNEGVRVMSCNVLTKTREFITPPDLEHTLTCVMGEDMTYSDPLEFSFTMQRGHVYHVRVGYVDVEWINENLMRYEDGQISQKSCSYQSPYAVQWINDKGGYEEFVFAGRQKITDKAKDNSFKQNYNDYERTDMVQSEPFGKEHTKEILLGVEGVTQEVFAILQTMATSWYIVHPEGRNLLMRLAVNDYNNEVDTAAQTRNFSIKLGIPTETTNLF
jgi:hypothetical protein